MTLPTWRDWLFSARTFGAAMLALYIGLAAPLPRPYWAMATVYFCSQPLSGATRSKSVYRVIGTLTGATMAIVLVPNLADAPVLLVGALATWIGICLYFSLLDRTPRSYAFMLSGYTAAIIGFPTVYDPSTIWDVAIARTEEITLGIVCASLVAILVFPRPVNGIVTMRVNAWLGDGARLALAVLAGERGGEQARGDLVRLAGDAAEIDLLATHLAYDAPRSRGVGAQVRALRLRMLMLLPILSAVVDRLSVLRAEGSLPPKLVDALDILHAWIRPDPPSLDLEQRRREETDADELRRALEAATPALHARSGWTDVVTASLTGRLLAYVDVALDCRALRRSIAGGLRMPDGLRIRPEAGVAAVRHRDVAMSALTSLGVAATVAVCCAFWIESGWPDGASAPEMAAVAACFFAAQDDPAPAILRFTNETFVAVVVIAVYQFAIFPRVHDFEVLALVLSPFLLFVGTMIARPETMGSGVAIAAMGLTVLALQGDYQGDFQSFANSNLALLAGMYGAAVLMQLLRSVGAEWAILRIVRAGRRTIAAVATRRGRIDRARYAGLMLDRLGLIAPRLASLEAGHALRTRDVLANIRVGLDVIDLRRIRASLDEPAAGLVRSLLDGLARAYRSGLQIDAGEILPRIDEALQAVVADGDGPGRREAVLALVGIRRGTCPGAPPFAPRPARDPRLVERAAG